MWNVVLHCLVLSDDFKSVDKADQKLILKTIYKKLTKEPEDYGSPLSGIYKGYWKLRVGDYRVIYKIVRDKILVIVIKIGIRRDGKIYKELIHRLKKL